ncbi:antibiotic biosynthesis monooxygenase [Thioclava sp. BHET1]|nr:antibiotic biosynthesis monooxygenase [Thioclava sp. BHET1]
MKKITLTGTLRCATAGEAALIARLLPEHSLLSRAETGCLSFEVRATADPLIWSVAETFADRAAFEAHQARTRDSLWGRETAAVERVYTIREHP